MADAGTKEEKRGLRQAIRKWREKRKAKKATTSTTTTSVTVLPKSAQSTTITNSPPSVPAPQILFAPRTETTIHSPADPRNRRTPPPATIKKPRNPRRNTAPADFWAQPGPTTTITATANSNSNPNSAPSTPKRKSRLSLRISRALSQSHSSPTQPIRPILSPTPSAPAPHNHQNRRATLQFTTASEIAVQTQHDAAKLVAAAEVIRRDKPKDWLDPGWRAKEAKIVEEQAELMRAGSVNLGRDDSGPLKRWEWGK